MIRWHARTSDAFLDSSGQKSAGVMPKTIMVPSELLKHVPIQASLDPRLTPRNDAHRAVAEDKLHAARMSAAERAEAGMLSEAGRKRAAVAIRRRRRARLDPWTATLLKSSVRRCSAGGKDVVL